MKIDLDLHIHSQASPDGRMSLEEIAARCRAEGISAAAVCDHDRVLTEAPPVSDVLLIPGVEVSTPYGHLLGLFVTAPIETRDFFEAAEAIRAQGGLAVLAHPFERTLDEARLDETVPLLHGVEVWNSRAERKNRRANAMAEEFAARHGLRRFAGSDAHVPQEIGLGRMTLEVEALTLPAVKAALLTADRQIAGRRAKARWTAASQFTKRRKNGSSLAGYGKWALFALKCCAQDLMNKGE